MSDSKPTPRPRRERSPETLEKRKRRAEEAAVAVIKAQQQADEEFIKLSKGPWYDTLTDSRGLKAPTFTAFFADRHVTMPYSLLKYCRSVNERSYVLRFADIEIRLVAEGACDFPFQQFRLDVQFMDAFAVYHQPKRGLSVSASLVIRTKEGETFEDL